MLAGLFTGLALLFAPPPSRACLVDMSVDANDPAPFYLFPNWVQTQVAIFDLAYCDSATCAWDPTAFQASLTGLTMVNYGSATGGPGGDLTNLYFCGGCTAACTAPNQTMTYAGIWTILGVPRPVWTWAVGTPLVFNTDPCNTKGGCASPCQVVLSFWVDVAACPADKATISLGPSYDPVANPASPGGASDEEGCTQPWNSVQDPSAKTIVYILKDADKTTAAPGDTITYTIYYGRPGTAPLSPITIFDSMPQYTHYINGSANPPLDPLWDPDPGPPMHLRWTLPGPFPVAGGQTGFVTFQLSVDWGNEPIEPGSGLSAAPENARLGNRAFASWGGGTCAVTGNTSPSADTVVKRFLYYMLADNDILFSSSLGQPPDEITYTLFVRNLSPTKTWWNVHIWDTIPPELDPWGPNEGFNDPCTGWTMTPSGCAAASPGRIVAGGLTLLTWNIDMPPGQTLTLQWKAAVKSATAAGATAVSIATLLEYGYNGVNGTGHSGTPTFFTHLAPIFLPTTYISYTSFFGGDAGNTTCPGIFLPFWPLNKKTDFSLYGLEIIGAGGWAQFGGVSPAIGTFIGSCTGGFTGLDPGGYGGCKVERAPAFYEPAGLISTCPTFPYHMIYKLVSNSPVLWQMRTLVLALNQDHAFYDPTTTMTYRGFTAYTYRLAGASDGPTRGDSLTIINTSTNPSIVYDPTLTTTAHLFRWNPGTLMYDYISSMDIDVESEGTIMGTQAAEQGFYMILSSQANIILHTAHNTFSTETDSGAADNHGTIAPSRDNGNVVTTVGNGHIYAIGEGWGSLNAGGTDTEFVVGNTGAATATYRIWRYEPNGTGPASIPAQLQGTSGRWILNALDTVPAGLFPGLTAPPNPHAYGGEFDRQGFTSATTALFKVELMSGGPISVYCGDFLPSVFSGGAVLHASDGAQTGKEFWYHETADQGYNCSGNKSAPISPVSNIDVFCPKQGMVVQAVATDGYTSTYTTNAADEVVAFMGVSFLTTAATKRDWKVNVVSGPNAIALYNMCMASEKGYTSPFVQTGVHYVIVTPPVVYSGQSFWITVVVMDQGDVTKTDYCGTTSFTGTDPFAKIENTSMDSYNFTWASSSACSSAPNQDGVKVFVNVVFNVLGQQSIVAADTIDGSITGLASFMVVGVDVKFTKEQRLTVAASGDTVQFKLCWSNYSSTSAFSFTITDSVPQGTTYVPDNVTAMNCGNSGGGVTVDVAYSSSTSATAPGPASFVTVAAGPVPAGAMWLRWTVKNVYVKSTGCVCFRVGVQ